MPIFEPIIDQKHVDNQETLPLHDKGRRVPTPNAGIEGHQHRNSRFTLQEHQRRPPRGDDLTERRHTSRELDQQGRYLNSINKARFEALVAREAPNQQPIREFSPNIQRSLFGEPSACPTPHILRIARKKFVNPRIINSELVPNIPRPYNAITATQTARDSEFERMRQELFDMNSRVHKTVSVALEIGHVLREAQSVMFTTEITRFHIPHPGIITMLKYNETKNLVQYVTTFTTTMGIADFTHELRDTDRILEVLLDVHPPRVVSRRPMVNDSGTRPNATQIHWKIQRDSLEDISV
ncbi:unnamed protein product [Cochlearia groenlandica]